MSDNLVEIYMNYRINRMLKYGLTIMHSDDSFLSECLSNYLRTYINSSYYRIFDTVSTNNYDDKVLLEEIEGKRLEMLDDLSNYELIDTNEVYEEKIKTINTSSKIVPFLIKLDLLRFEDKDEAVIKIKDLLERDSFVRELLLENTVKLVSLVNETKEKMDEFFLRKDTYFSLDYPLFKDRDNYVWVNINNDVKLLQDNYKKSLVERVYRDKKIQEDKLDLKIKKFIKQLLFDLYNGMDLYDKYFIEIEDSLFEDRKDIEKYFVMLDNPLIKRYLTLAISTDSFNSNQAFIKKYGFSIACIQDFSHINDVDTKLTNLDNSLVFDFVIVKAFKDKDYNTFMKYTPVNMRDILFNKEV